MVGPKRRRRRPAVSCIPCRKRKVRCDQNLPCSNCSRARNATCVYRALSPPPSPRRRVANLALGPRLSQEYPSPASAAGTGTLPSPSTEGPPRHSGFTNDPSLSEYEAMKNRIHQLEERLSLQSRTSHGTSPLTLSSSLMGTLYVHRQGQSPSQDTGMQSITHKGRMFGQSHWLNSFVQIQDIFEIMELHVRAEKTALLSVERCKYLARVIKNQRAPSWPTPLTPELPSREVCDGLVECYMQTTESVYRVLHIPSFRQEYEALWGPDPSPSPGFLVQLKLILAIGATVYDDEYSLRTLATRWIYEAQTFLCEPEFKTRLTTRSLQIHILHLFARRTANIGESLVWISVGELLRTANFMGLHRDPSGMPNVSVLACEMQRRLWNTVLEVVVQSSMDSGGPPQISLVDFDTQPPRNLSDEQLLDENVTPAPDNSFTQTSIARALRASLATRLAVAKHLNDLDSKGTYEEALKLDKELRVAHKSMTRELEVFHPHESLTSAGVGLRLANIIMASYISALHTPFLSIAFREPTYAYSRMALLQNSLKLWPIISPVSTLASHDGEATTPTGDIWTRLTVCDHRIFHVAVNQASVVIAMEIRAQSQDDVIGAVPFRADLLDVLSEVKSWKLECVRAGETNIKTYLGACLIFCYADGMKRGIGKEELSRYLVQAVRDAADECLPLLQAMLSSGDGEEGLGEMQGALPTPSEGLDLDCILPLSDFQQGLGTWDPLGWVLDEESTGGLMGW